jgi:hypothetical protein
MLIHFNLSVVAKVVSRMDKEFWSGAPFDAEILLI